MKRLVALACAISVGLVLGAPMSAGAEPSSLGLMPATSGEPAAGGDAVVRYWGEGDHLAFSLVFIGVGIPGATIQVSVPGEETASAKVATDGTWLAQLGVDQSRPSSVTITQLVGGSVHDKQSIPIEDPLNPGSAAPSGFEVTSGECFVDGDSLSLTYWGTGKPASTVQVHANADQSAQPPEFVPVGRFTVPVDGTWKMTIETSVGGLAPPMLFDVYDDGVWKGGMVYSQPGDCGGAGDSPRATGTTVTLTPIPTAVPSPSATPTPSAATSAAATPAPSATERAPSSGGGVPGWVWAAIGAAVVVAAGVLTWILRRRAASASGAAVAGRPSGSDEPGDSGANRPTE